MNCQLIIQIVKPTN